MTTTTTERPTTRNASWSPTLDAPTPRRNGRPERPPRKRESKSKPPVTADLIDAQWLAAKHLEEYEQVGQPNAEAAREMIACAGADVVAGEVAHDAFNTELISSCELLVQALRTIYVRYRFGADRLEIATLAMCSAVLERYEDREPLRVVLAELMDRDSDAGGSAGGLMAGILLSLTGDKNLADESFREAVDYGVRWIVRDLAHVFEEHEGVTYTEGAAMASAEIRRALVKVRG